MDGRRVLAGALIIIEVVVLDGWIVVVLDAAPECVSLLCPCRGLCTDERIAEAVVLDGGLTSYSIRR